jgi:hypothetical protein
MSRRSYGQKTLSKYHLTSLHACSLTCQLPRSSSAPFPLCSLSTPSSIYGRDIWKLEPIQISSTTCATTTVQPPLPASLSRRTSLGSRLFLRMLVSSVCSSANVQSLEAGPTRGVRYRHRRRCPGRQRSLSGTSAKGHHQLAQGQLHHDSR